jgi:hypothetical protein
MVQIHDGELLSHGEEWSYVIFKKMDETVNHHGKQNKEDSETQTSGFLSYA